MAETTVFGLDAMVDSIHEHLTTGEGAISIQKKQIKAVLKAEQDLIVGAVAGGDKVTYMGFGTFESRERSARKGRNPQTGEPIEIKAKKAPAFKPGKGFKDALV